MFEPPFYRFYLRPKKYSDQHEMLLELESQGNNVYYVAPKFHLTSELNDGYLNGEIIERSLFLRPAQIGNISDDSNHHVAFRDGYPPYLLSEPRQIAETVNGRPSLLDAMTDIALTKDNPVLSIERLTEIASGMVSIIERSRVGATIDKELFNRLQELAPDEQLGYMARTFFDCELFIVEAT